MLGVVMRRGSVEQTWALKEAESVVAVAAAVVAEIVAVATLSMFDSNFRFEKRHEFE